MLVYTLLALWIVPMVSNLLFAVYDRPRGRLTAPEIVFIFLPIANFVLMLFILALWVSVKIFPKHL